MKEQVLIRFNRLRSALLVVSLVSPAVLAQEILKPEASKAFMCSWAMPPQPIIPKLIFLVKLSDIYQDPNLSFSLENP